MVSLIEKLNDCTVLCYAVWEFLTIKDICELIRVDKNVRLISLLINQIIPQQITINFDTSLVSKYQLAMHHIFHNFPNIYNLYLKNLNDPLENDCMFELFNTVSICNSLKELSIYITNNNCECISNLSKLEILDIGNSPISNSNALVEICSMKNITSLDICHCQ